MLLCYHVNFGEKINAKKLSKWQNWNWGFNELSINLFARATHRTRNCDLRVCGRVRVRAHALNDKACIC